MTSIEKIRDAEALLTWRQAQPGAVTVVTGTFDLLHPGNLYALARAHALGQPVVVVVEPDDMASRHTGTGRPQNSLVTRVEQVSWLRTAQAVTTVTAAAAVGFFKALAPYVWVTAGDPARDEPYGAALMAAAGRVERIAPLAGCFARDILRAMQEHRTPLALPAGWNGAVSSPSAVVSGGNVVSVNGCFDILHVGHLRFLAEAREMGDSLTVFMNSDASVARYKGPTRPVFPEGFRQAALEALEPVDEVIVFGGDNPLEEINRCRPRIHVKGGSYEPERVRQERELVESWGGRLVCTPLVDGFSTTNFIRKALARAL